jgi:hypothetical protein
VGPRYYFGKLRDPLEGLVPSFGDIGLFRGSTPFADPEPFPAPTGAGGDPFTGAAPFAGVPG